MRVFVWWNFVILVLKSRLPSLTTDSGVTECYTDINADGFVANNSQLPTCADTERINLLAYDYRKCNPASNCTYLSNLSSVAEVSIHESCSFKQSCKSLRLPIDDIPTHDNHTTNVLHVRYRCVEQNSFIDFCSETGANISTTLHLILTENATFMEGCECRVDGNFSLAVSDVRLNAKNSTLCSPTVINVQVLATSTLYFCKNEKDSYFREVSEIYHSATIALKAHSSEVLPDMVWLTLKPYISLKIDCVYFPRTDATTIRLTDSTPASSSQHPSSSPADSSTTIAGLSVFVVLATIVAVIYVLLKVRKKIRRKVRSDKETLQAADDLNVKDSRTDCESASIGNTTENIYTQINSESHTEDPKLQEKHVYAKAIKCRSIRTDPNAEEEPYDVIAVNRRTPSVTPNYDHVVLDSNFRVHESGLTLEDH